MHNQNKNSPIDKAMVTNLCALVLALLGFVSPFYAENIRSIGFFALSGAITNWLAVHMLFEKIPYIYGSGVIPNQFMQFKTEIRKLIMSQFFTYENILRYFESEDTNHAINPDEAMQRINFDKVFNAFVEAILSSPFGSMLGMFGGDKIIDGLKEPVIRDLKKTIRDIISNDLVKVGVNSSSQITKIVIEKIEGIVEQRLNELTPQMVKIIVQEMIKNHLGWLVVWGGVFGGVIGLLISFIP